MTPLKTYRPEGTYDLPLRRRREWWGLDSHLWSPSVGGGGREVYLFFIGLNPVIQGFLL